jgi:hypothetical protein
MSLKGGGSGLGFQLQHDALEFGHQAVGAVAENVEDGAVIPQCAVATSGETVEDGVAVKAIFGEDGADVVKFVGRGDEARVVVGVGEMGEVVELALLPWRLGNRVGVGAAFDDASDAIAEAVAELGEHRFAPAVFDNVVKQGRDGLIFIASGFEDERGDGHEVGDVGDARFLAGLGGMLFGGEEKRFVEAGSEMWSRRHEFRAASVNSQVSVKERREPGAALLYLLA